MDPLRYRRINDILADALDLSLDERTAYLQEACGEDGELREEVESLLRYVEVDDDFLEPVNSAALPVSDDARVESTCNPDPLIGRQVSNYRILDRLGEGGMGVVYLAEDLRLGRRAALKFLKDELIADDAFRSRFLREARMGAALDHPNICTVYGVGDTESGQMFVAMAYYEGETLKQRIARGPLSLESALDIVCQIGSGLGAAHAAGVVHRDVKPSNILLAATRVKILDFGIAKLIDQAGLTLPGAAIGTNAYSSPQQAAGGAVDHRTDIWSLGVVLYELLAGRKPFDVERAGASALATLLLPPPRLVHFCPEVPEELETCVLRALAVDPLVRYQHVGHFVAALEDIRLRSRSIAVARRKTKPASAAPPSTPDAWTLAILPCPRGDESDAEGLLAEAMIDALRERLWILPGVRVVRCSSLADAATLSDAVEGRIERLRVATTVSANATTTVVSRVLDSESTRTGCDVSASVPPSHLCRLPSELARTVVDSLGIEVGPERRQQILQVHQVGTDAYVKYLIARHLLDRGSLVAYETSVRYFEDVIASCPAWSAAFAGLVEACVGVVEQLGLPQAEFCVARARSALAKARHLAPRAVEVQAAAAEVEYRLDWSLDAATARLRRVLQRLPSSARLRCRLAECLVASGQLHDGVRLAKEAAVLDPFCQRTLIRSGRVLHFAGDYAESARTLRSALAIGPEAAVARLDLALTLAKAGHSDHAGLEWDRALDSPDGRALVAAALGNAARAGGESHQYDAASAIVHSLQHATSAGGAAAALLDMRFGDTRWPLEYLASPRPSALRGYLGLTSLRGSLSSLVDRVGLIGYVALDDSFRNLAGIGSVRALTQLRDQISTARVTQVVKPT